ncbi:MAG: hypothetical protein HZC54_00685 [Verrucomicrobia bacterium]|nr:hypothetical protein [Verrucomicrobiota bacterium]
MRKIPIILVLACLLQSGCSAWFVPNPYYSLCGNAAFEQQEKEWEKAAEYWANKEAEITKGK